MAVSENGDIVTSSLDHTTKMWLPIKEQIKAKAAVTELGQVKGHDAEISALAFSNDGTMLLSGSR